MEEALHTIFPLAAKYFYKKFREEGGSQKQFAEDLGVTKTYLSSIINGSRTASIELQNRIANYLYGPYDKFLAVGRCLMEGEEPFTEKKIILEDNVESLIARLTYYIVGHKKLTEELAETKQLYELVVENLQSGVFVTDAGDCIIFINKFMTEHTGVPREKIVGVNMMKAGTVFPKGEFSQIQQQYVHAKKSLQPKAFENIPVTTPAGAQVYQSGWMIPRVKEGQFDGMVVTVNDSTRTQTLLNLLKLSLDDSDTAQGIVAQSRPGGEISVFYINKKMRKLVGQTDPEYLNYTVQESLKTASERMKNGTDFLEYLKFNFASGRDRAKFIIEMKNGEKYEWSSASLYDEEGKYWGRSSKARKIKKAGATKK